MLANHLEQQFVFCYMAKLGILGIRIEVLSHPSNIGLFKSSTVSFTDDESGYCHFKSSLSAVIEALCWIGKALN